MIIEPIAYIKNDFTDKFGIPRQSGRIEEIISTVIFEKKYRDENSLKEIECFSHLWLIFDFSLSHTEKFSPTVRPPRLGGNKRVGVFASRSPFRPNSLGLSCVKLLGVEKTKNNGTVLKVSGADLLNNTPIYDIKPYIPYSDCKPDAVGGYAEDNKNHSVEVIFEEGVKEKIPPDKLDIIIKLLSEDPKPSYKKDNKIYKMKYASYEISFTYVGECLKILCFN